MHRSSRMAATPRSTALAALVTCGLLLTGCSSGSSADAAAPSSPTLSGASSSTGPASPTTVSTEPGPADGDDALERVLPAALFESGGLTLQEYEERTADHDFYDEDEQLVLKESLGTGRQQLTVDLQKGDVVTVVLVCPEEARGSSDIFILPGAGGEPDWKAGSQWCGVTAGLPAREESGPLSVITMTENDRPYRVALAVARR